jgi:XTP/dITP diphosphohydrolase
MPRTVVFASNNRGKVAELATMFADLEFDLQPQSAFGVPEIAETGLSFAENALIKARNACLHTGLPAIADDSGLAVAALSGAPGIYSARYSGANATDAQNNARLLGALAGIPHSRRHAQFHCLLVYLSHPEDPVPLICDGRWDGVILDAPRGEGGFGYDPLFYLPELGLTAAELEPAQKNQLSHRGQAVRELVRRLRTA